MNPDDNIEYSKTQLNEARRRLDSVRNRVTEVQKERIYGLVDEEEETITVGEEVDEPPEENQDFVVIEERSKEVETIDGHVQNIIIDCQMCIELSVKSMFKAVGQDFDYSHGIGFDSHNTIDFNREIPEDFSRRAEITRAIFLTQLWEKFYEIAKYGAPELNVEPSHIFDIKDGERALNDASFCVELAEDFITHIEE